MKLDDVRVVCAYNATNMDMERGKAKQNILHQGVVLVYTKENKISAHTNGNAALRSAIPHKTKQNKQNKQKTRDNTETNPAQSTI